MFNERVSDTRSYVSKNPQDVPVTPPSPAELQRRLFEAIPRFKGRPHASVEGAIRWTLHVLFEEKAVVEVRAFKDGRVMSGFYNDHDALAEAAAELDARTYQVYVTLNPVNEALLGRSANQISERPRATTSDADIARRGYLLLDFDPAREADASATQEEREAAYLTAKEVRDYLRGQGWPEPVIADSGNGFNFLYPLDLPNDADSKRLVRGVLEALASEFDDDRVKIDTAVHNASRLIRLYGSRNRKGVHTEERPHRCSRIIKTPEGRNTEIVTLEMLEAVALTKRERTSPRDRVSEKAGGQIREGHRNTTLASMAGTMRRRGFGEEAIFAALEITNREKCDPMLDNGEVRDIARSIAGYAPRHGNERGPDADAGIRLSEVEPEQVDWLWTGRIPKGKLSIIDGDPGTGKSAATTDLAARVSAGGTMPDDTCCEAAGVVICSAEDGLADTVRPRLDAAGGDPAKVLSLATVTDEEGLERPLSIPEDIPVIEESIKRVEAALVVIDPLMAFLGGKADSYRDQDVRRALAPLSLVAEETGAAIVIVRHLNKSGGKNPIYRGGGSIGIIGAARTGMLIAKDPDDEDRRVLSIVKSNLAAPARSLAFTLEEADNGAVRVNWRGEVNLSAADLLGASRTDERPSALEEAEEFLRELLADGPVPKQEVEAEAEEAGIKMRTMKRAKEELDVQSEREGEPGRQGGGRWVWSLPEG